MNQDDDHLNQLKIFHYIVGGVGCFFACFPLIHVAIGLMLVVGGVFPELEGEAAPPDAIGWLFVVIGSGFFLFGQACSICIILSGKYLKKRINYNFSFIVACVSCMFIPFGTILGIFTIIVMSRDSVKQIYEQKRANVYGQEEDEEPYGYEQ